MNILCVGNSFAVDASTYVHQIAKSIGVDINIYVLYIGGCPIDLHWKNVLTKDKAYDFYANGNMNPLMRCDIFEGLNYTKYDYITFQQRSGDSGDASTFFPELLFLMEEIRKHSDATFLLHKTWSYAKTFAHSKYGENPLDQDQMDKDIKDAYLQVSKKSGIKYIIPSGEAIILARKIFGDNLNRDGYHLNELGRTLTGILWALYFSNAKIDNLDKFMPSGYSYDDSTPPVNAEEIKKLLKIAYQAIENNKGYNLYD